MFVLSFDSQICGRKHFICWYTRKLITIWSPFYVCYKHCTETCCDIIVCKRKSSECIFHTRKITVIQASQCRGVISWEMNFCNYTYKHTIRHASLIKLKLDFQHDIAMICSCMSHSIVVATYELEREMNYLWLSSNTNGWTIWEMSGVWQRACLLKQDSHL